MSVQSAAAVYADLREKRQDVECALKDLKAQEDQAEADLFHAMREEGFKSFNSEELGYQFISRTQRYPRLKDKMREDDMLAWLEEQGYGGVIKRQVHPSTLKATLASISETLDGVLPDFLEVYEQDGVAMKKVAK